MNVFVDFKTEIVNNAKILIVVAQAGDERTDYNKSQKV